MRGVKVKNHPFQCLGSLESFNCTPACSRRYLTAGISVDLNMCSESVCGWNYRDSLISPERSSKINDEIIHLSVGAETVQALPLFPVLWMCKIVRSHSCPHDVRAPGNVAKTHDINLKRASIGGDTE